MVLPLPSQFNSDRYVQHYNDNMNTGLTHTLASGAASTWTVQLGVCGE